MNFSSHYKVKTSSTKIEVCAINQKSIFHETLDEAETISDQNCGIRRKEDFKQFNKKTETE